eukprot:SM000127S26607  [mRNA]  locus=s127:25293:28790:+ [translate_table: standard]
MASLGGGGGGGGVGGAAARVDAATPPRQGGALSFSPASAAAASTGEAEGGAAAEAGLAMEDDPSARHKMVVPAELAAAVARLDAGFPVTATIANFAFEAMLRNWAHHALAAGMPNIVVAALDDETVQLCANLSVAAVKIHSSVASSANFRADAVKFKNMGAMKTAFVLGLLEHSFDVLMSDTDTVWLRNPAEFLDVRSGPLAGAHILISSDSLSHANDEASMAADSSKRVKERERHEWFRTATPRGRELFGNVYEHAFNTGVLLLRSAPATLKFAAAWHDVMRTKGKSMGWEGVWGDQHALNQLLRIRMFPIEVVESQLGHKRNNRVVYVYGRQMWAGILPVSLFCNGHVYFVQRIPQRHGLVPYVVHNTFQFHFAPGKIARFREAELWALDPPSCGPTPQLLPFPLGTSFYYEEGNFLLFRVDLPPTILDLPMDQRHRAALQHYYEAIRNALILAKLLNRTLILPRVTCFCDRWWDSLTAPCRAPGADVEPPFDCPIDYLLDPGVWNSHPLWYSYRVHTFLDHPKVPAAIKDSRMEVEVVIPKESPGLSSNSRALLRHNATSIEVLAALSHLKNVRVLHITNVIDAFCRFDTEVENARFDWSVLNYFSQDWCCVPVNSSDKVTRVAEGHRVIRIPKLASRTMEDCHRSPVLRRGIVKETLLLVDDRPGRS